MEKLQKIKISFKRWRTAFFISAAITAIFVCGLPQVTNAIGFILYKLVPTLFYTGSDPNYDSNFGAGLTCALALLGLVISVISTIFIGFVLLAFMNTMLTQERLLKQKSINTHETE